MNFTGSNICEVEELRITTTKDMKFLIVVQWYQFLSWYKRTSLHVTNEKIIRGQWYTCINLVVYVNSYAKWPKNLVYFLNHACRNVICAAHLRLLNTIRPRCIYDIDLVQAAQFSSDYRSSIPSTMYFFVLYSMNKNYRKIVWC